jgi:hypothetical protein
MGRSRFIYYLFIILRMMTRIIFWDSTHFGHDRLGSRLKNISNKKCEARNSSYIDKYFKRHLESNLMKSLVKISKELIFFKFYI